MTRESRSHLVLLLAAAMALPAVACADEARSWLDRMSHSFRELNYSGVFTYENGEDMNALRIVHAVVDGEERERVEHLNGPVREVLREGHHVSCVHAGDQLVRLDHTIPSGPFAKKFGAGLGKLEDHYSLQVKGEDRVADRAAVLIDVLPKDSFRYGYELALDRETGMLLRSTLRNEQGRVLERFQFAELRIGGEPDLDALQARSGGAVRAHHHLVAPEQAEDRAETRRQWQVSWLPRGFMMAASDLRREPRKSSMVESQMYTDGLAVFSVFVERRDPGEVASGSARRGATVAYTMMMPGGEGDVVTVVGEVPLATAQRVANSVRVASTSVQ